MNYLITTRHPEFADWDFPEGSTVIDPWRYVTDRPGVTVKRLGENKPELISILCPTRDRWEEFGRMRSSALDLATHPNRVEVIYYLDWDDPQHVEYVKRWPKGAICGERIILSEMWNECLSYAKGEILMHCGDDIVFRTPGWDSVVRRTFAESQDKLILVHGDDCSPNTDALATHGFLHRRWVETVGYFLPPIFSSDWNDVWLTEVADMVGRRIKIPIVTEHMHYSFGKAERDQNTAEREERGIRDGVVDLYKRTQADRVRDAAKLKAAMA